MSDKDTIEPNDNNEEDTPFIDGTEEGTEIPNSPTGDDEGDFGILDDGDEGGGDEGGGDEGESPNSKRTRLWWLGYL